MEKMRVYSQMCNHNELYEENVQRPIVQNRWTMFEPNDRLSLTLLK